MKSSSSSKFWRQIHWAYASWVNQHTIDIHAHSTSWRDNFNEMKMYDEYNFLVRLLHKFINNNLMNKRQQSNDFHTLFSSHFAPRRGNDISYRKLCVQFWIYTHSRLMQCEWRLPNNRTTNIRPHHMRILVSRFVWMPEWIAFWGLNLLIYFW